MNSSDLNSVRLTDCPRDAMQGMKTFIPTDRKIDYMNQMMKVGFDILDFGSFVSPTAIPQLADTAQVLEKMDVDQRDTQLLSIVGNLRGAKQAAQYSKISWLGFPFSVSDTFLRRNLNSNSDKAFGMAAEMVNLCSRHQKKLMIYLSMGFGNPYGEPWSEDLLAQWVDKLAAEGVEEINLSDTVGVSTDRNVAAVFRLLANEFPSVRFGFHLHSRSDDWYNRIDAAWKNGCRSFDGVLLGGGGCPMTGVDLVGNLSMQNLVSYFSDHQVPLNMNQEAFLQAKKASETLLSDIELNFKLK